MSGGDEVVEGQGVSAYYQIRNVPRKVLKGIKVAAALEGISMNEWIIKALKRQTENAGIRYEKGD